MLRISGYGQTGPYRDKPGFGVLGEAMGGLRHLTGEPGRVPVRVGVSIGDTLAALHGVIGVLIALRHRDAHGGEGQMHRRGAVRKSVFNVMESLLPEYDAFGAVRERAGSALPGIAPTNAYRAATAGSPRRRQRRQHLPAADAAIGRAGPRGRPGPRSKTTAASRAARNSMRRSAPGPRRVIRAEVLEIARRRQRAGRAGSTRSPTSPRDPQYLAREMIVETHDRRRPAVEGARASCRSCGARRARSPPGAAPG